MPSEPARKWRKAYPDISINDDALETMAPFASLHANDFAVYVEGKARGSDELVGHLVKAGIDATQAKQIASNAALGRETVEFMRSLAREMVWVYGNWQKAQRDGNPAALLDDLMRNADRSGEYDFVRKFIGDYAAANNIQLTPTTEVAGWEAILPPERLVP